MRPKSVLIGKDPEALVTLLSIHCSVENPQILDVTYNEGRIWKGLNYHPVRMDIDWQHPVDIVADFAAIPIADESFDVIVFDPPHLPTSAANHTSSKIWEKRFGATANGKGRSGPNVVGMFAPFLLEASRVLKKGGIVLAKIVDLINNHRYQWQQVEFVNCCWQCGLTPCDMLIKCDRCKANLTSSTWKSVRHLRMAHCYWVVVRKPVWSIATSPHESGLAP